MSLTTVGIQTVQNLMETNLHELTTTLLTLKVANINKLTSTIDSELLNDWLEKNALYNIKDVLHSHDILGLEKLRELDNEQITSISGLITNKNEQVKFMKLVNEFHGDDQDNSVPTVKCKLVCLCVNHDILSVHCMQTIMHTSATCTYNTVQHTHTLYPSSHYTHTLQ